MKKLRFIIPSLLAAGFAAEKLEATPPTDSTKDTTSKNPYIDVFQLDHKYNLAAHRSHSSHSSHRSHRSSSGGTVTPPYTPPSQPETVTPPARPEPSTPPSRNLESTPPSSVLPRSPSTAPQQTLPGNSKKFAEIVRRVQAALYAQGYYTGPLDGAVGPDTRAALSKFQRDHGLPVTGTITPETLNALRVAAN
jgi:His-Xaa-Ser repeat protein HxsA